MLEYDEKNNDDSNLLTLLPVDIFCYLLTFLNAKSIVNLKLSSKVIQQLITKAFRKTLCTDSLITPLLEDLSVCEISTLPKLPNHSEIDIYPLYQALIILKQGQKKYYPTAYDLTIPFLDSHVEARIILNIWRSRTYNDINDLQSTLFSFKYAEAIYDSHKTLYTALNLANHILMLIQQMEKYSLEVSKDHLTANSILKRLILEFMDGFSIKHRAVDNQLYHTLVSSLTDAKNAPQLPLSEANAIASKIVLKGFFVTKQDNHMKVALNPIKYPIPQDSIFFELLKGEFGKISPNLLDSFNKLLPNDQLIFLKFICENPKLATIAIKFAELKLYEELFTCDRSLLVLLAPEQAHWILDIYKSSIIHEIEETKTSNEFDNYDFIKLFTDRDFKSCVSENELSLKSAWEKFLLLKIPFKSTLTPKEHKVLNLAVLNSKWDIAQILLKANYTDSFIIAILKNNAITSKQDAIRFISIHQQYQIYREEYHSYKIVPYLLACSDNTLRKVASILKGDEQNSFHTACFLLQLQKFAEDKKYADYTGKVIDKFTNNQLNRISKNNHWRTLFLCEDVTSSPWFQLLSNFQIINFGYQIINQLKSEVSEMQAFIVVELIKMNKPNPDKADLLMIANNFIPMTTDVPIEITPTTFSPQQETFQNPKDEVIDLTHTTETSLEMSEDSYELNPTMIDEDEIVTTDSELRKQIIARIESLQTEISEYEKTSKRSQPDINRAVKKVRVELDEKEDPLRFIY